jgi:UDPglucose 6-dehydrogenase
MNICVIGSGYVGLVTGACFADFGVNVTCVDIDEKKIEGLKNGILPIYEPGLDSIVEKNFKQGRLTFTTDFQSAIKDSLVIFIAVGTPYTDGGKADLSFVDVVAKDIGEHMNSYKVVVTKSTVPPGTAMRLKAIIENAQGEETHPFDMVSNPEFLREGSAIEDFMRPNRVVVGSTSEQAMAIMKDLYRPLYLLDTPFVMTNVETSETIKYASNAFLAMKISFINEVANLCEKVGADVSHVARGMGLDKRIGSKFLHAGPGYGGSCFPKDTEAFLSLAEDNGVDFKLVRSTIEANTTQRSLAVEKIIKTMGSPEGKLIAIAGLAFKPNTDDMRYAPSIDIINALQDLGARIRAFDPVAMEEAKKEVRDVEYVNNAYELVEGADALIVVTEWNQFRNMDLERIKGLMKTPVLVDLRNVYDPQAARKLGFKYASTGRL